MNVSWALRPCRAFARPRGFIEGFSRGILQFGGFTIVIYRIARAVVSSAFNLV